jgi:hypothetical protein
MALPSGLKGLKLWLQRTSLHSTLLVANLPNACCSRLKAIVECVTGRLESDIYHPEPKNTNAPRLAASSGSISDPSAV